MDSANAHALPSTMFAVEGDSTDKKLPVQDVDMSAVDPGVEPPDLTVDEIGM